MKKPTKESSEWNRIHALNIQKRVDSKSDSSSKGHAGGIPTRGTITDWIVLPKAITLRNGNLRIALAPLFSGRDIKLLHLDFRDVESFYPCGTLYLYACLDEYQNNHGQRALKILRLPKAMLPKELMFKLGFLMLLGLSDAYPSTRSNVTKWGLHNGQTTDLESEFTIVEKLIQDEFGHHNIEYNSALYGAALEAVTNCRDHAYKGVSKDRDTNWWLIYGFTEKGFSLVVTDLGIPFSKTVPVSSIENIQQRIMNLQKFRPTIEDNQYIEIAVLSSIERSEALRNKKKPAKSKSSTGKKERGFGLSDISSLHNMPGATVRIYSNHGLFYRRCSKEALTINEKGLDLKFPIEGTTIIWTLPID